MSELARKIDTEKFQSFFRRPNIDPIMLDHIDAGGWLVSNDQGYQSVALSLHRLQKSKDPGIGLFVGSGGLLSMLPDINIELAIMADASRSVVAFNRAVASTVEASSKPEQAIDFITSPTFRMLLKEDGVRFKQSRREIGRMIEDEAAAYGGFHWTTTNRFTVVQRALGEIPIIWAWDEISSPQFSRALRNIFDETGRKLTFANFTNFHEWLSSIPESREPETFMREWLVGPLATLHSLRTDEQMRLSPSLDDYLTVTSER